MYIAHEAPLSIMNTVQPLTDYDYCLVHLLEESRKYLKFFLDAKKKGRKIIMDCSLFELGHAFDFEKYYKWLRKLQPDQYIIPDVWQDTEANINSYDNFLKSFNLSKLSGMKIGVIQGKTYEDLKRCYQFMDERADKIAISFGYDFYYENFAEEALKEIELEISETEDIHSDDFIKNKLKPMSFCVGRINLIERLLSDGVINHNKPHHLLGCGTPLEFTHYKLYQNEYPFLESLDTSHPIISGFHNNDYENYDVWIQKNPQKMIEIFDKKTDQNQLHTILKNIRIFRDRIF